MQFDIALLEKIKKQAIKHNYTLAVAESVSSGFLQAAFSQTKDALKFYQGGITVYNLGQKVKHLSVDPILADECNCVAPWVAEKMALKVCELFNSTVGIAISGYASQVPELGINKLFAYTAISINGKVKSKKILPKVKEQGLPVQMDYTQQILALLYETLKE